MKKIVSVLACFTMLMSVFPATAALNCGALAAGASCSTVGGAASEWSANCTYGGVTQTVKGVALCAYNTSGGSIGQAFSSIGFYGGLGNDTQCYCKMVSPGLSGNWVFANAMMNEAACISDCAAECARLISSNSTFRTNLFSAIEK